MEPIAITGYRLEYVDVPAAKDKAQVVREVLGASPPTPPPGPPTRMLRIIMEGDNFPISEEPFEIRIGDQVLRSMSVLGPGTAASGLLQRRPSEGDQIAIHVPSGAPEEPRVLIAGVFDPDLLDDATA